MLAPFYFSLSSLYVGQYRWAPPRPVLPWHSIRPAKDFAPGCPQNCDLPPLTCPATTSEDCLTLNIYTPLSGDNWPVVCFFLFSIFFLFQLLMNHFFIQMVYVPGGEFEQGTADTVLFDGTAIAAQTQTLVVVINYRLGTLGFLRTGSFAGNYGFMDQQYALQWVQRNIDAFGGNPQAVTLFGQSAGGTSTTSHLISPQSKGLYHRAIVESNPVALNLNTAELQEHYSSEFAKFAGCGDKEGSLLTACLLNLTIPEILSAQATVGKHVNPADPIYIFYPWTPTIDGNIVPGQPVNLFPKGQFNHVPMILGNVHDEAWMFIWEVQPLPIPSVEYYAILEGLFGSNAPAVEKLYPVSPLEKDTRPQLNNVITDYLFICPGRWLVENALKNDPQLPIYHYEFNHVLSYYEAWGDDYSFCWFDYVCHAAELPMVFDSATVGGYTPTPEENVLSENMVAYWGNFAHTGNPNQGPGKPDFDWPLYNNNSMITMNLNLTLGTITNLRGEYCDYWDSVGYFQP